MSAAGQDEPVSERWETPEAIAAAYERFVAAIPGWRPPAAYGLGVPAGDGTEIEFVRVNVGEHPLPAVVLATVCGHTAGTASYVMDVPALDRAIALLEPAEACTAYEHPNLWAWRRLRTELADDARVVAVFVDDVTADDGDAAVAALRRAIQHSAPQGA